MKRGQVYYADLRPVIGSEQGGIRPVVIIQNDTGNAHSPTVIIAVMTTKQKANLPTHIPLSEKDKNLDLNSTIMLEQIRTVDKSRLSSYIGDLSRETMNKVDEAIKISLELNKKERKEEKVLNELQIFKNEEFGSVRTTTIDGEPWFVASDIAKALGYRMASDLTRRIDEEDKGTHLMSTPSGEQNMTVINESGLYEAILGSKIPTAKKFKRWVTSEVLPSIRKNGGYIAGQENLSDDELLEKAILVAQRKIEERDRIIEQQRQKIEQDKPKIIFAEAVSTSKDSILIGDLAKLICQNGVQIGQKRLFDWLRQNNFLIKYGSSRNMPQQRYVEQGLFEVKESNVQNPDGSARITRTTKVTGKGQVYFVNKFIRNEAFA